MSETHTPIKCFHCGKAPWAWGIDMYLLEAKFEDNEQRLYICNTDLWPYLEGLIVLRPLMFNFNLVLLP